MTKYLLFFFFLSCFKNYETPLSYYHYDVTKSDVSKRVGIPVEQIEIDIKKYFDHKGFFSFPTNENMDKISRSMHLQSFSEVHSWLCGLNKKYEKISSDYLTPFMHDYIIQRDEIKV